MKNSRLIVLLTILNLFAQSANCDPVDPQKIDLIKSALEAQLPSVFAIEELQKYDINLEEIKKIPFAVKVYPPREPGGKYGFSIVWSISVGTALVWNDNPNSSVAATMMPTTPRSIILSLGSSTGMGNRDWSVSKSSRITSLPYIGVGYHLKTLNPDPELEEKLLAITNAIAVQLGPLLENDPKSRMITEEIEKTD